MKFLFFFTVLFVALICWASAQPVEALEDDFVQDATVHHRDKRATCPWFPRACVIHCRSKGFSTGFCRGGTCTCKNN